MTNTFGAIGVLFLGLSLQAAPIAGLYNTGVDNAGVQLPGGNGVTELHWLQNNTTAVTYLNAAYIPETLTGVGSDLSRWISDSGSGGSIPGTIPYTLTFTLASPTATITGRWAADNCGTASLNGGSAFTSITNCSSASFNSWTAFAINSGFVTGLNTLTFQLQNFGGPAALRVEFLQSDTEAAVPEPSTFALTAGALLAAGAMRRRRISRV